MFIGLVLLQKWPRGSHFWLLGLICKPLHVGVPLVVDLTRLYGLTTTPASLVESTPESQRGSLCGHRIGEMIAC